MDYSTEITLNLLVDRLTAIPEVRSIGISGKKSPLPKPGEGDIDVFIYCDSIPSPETRLVTLERMGDYISESKICVLEGGHWGIGDYTLIDSIETWLMYFTINETNSEIDAILNGDYPDKLDNYYYPVGRCAMMKDMSILCDKDGFLESVKFKLVPYPEKLAAILTEYHSEMLSDFEDMERAVYRKDVLFYHFAMDIALDHFLQALYAKNRTFFPSRKSSMEYIEGFGTKPSGCGRRLLEIIRAGADPDEVSRSYALWRDLLKEFNELPL